MERLEKKAGGYHLEFEDDAQWSIGDEPSTERMTAERPGDTRRTEAAAVSRRGIEQLRIADTEPKSKIDKSVIIEENVGEETRERPRESPHRVLHLIIGERDAVTSRETAISSGYPTGPHVGGAAKSGRDSGPHEMGGR